MELTGILLLLLLPLLAAWRNEVERRKQAEDRLKKIKRAILISNAMSAEQLDALIG